MGLELFVLMLCLIWIHNELDRSDESYFLRNLLFAGTIA